jgi:hypothetical protein
MKDDPDSTYPVQYKPMYDDDDPVDRMEGINQNTLKLIVKVLLVTVIGLLTLYYCTTK